MPSISTLQKANFSSCTPEERAVPVSPKCQTPHFSRHVSGLRWNLRPGLYVGLPLVSYGLLTHHSNSYLGAPSFSGSDASQALCRVVKVVWGGHKKGLLYAFSSYRDRSTLKQVSGLTLAILGFEEDVVNASLWIMWWVSNLYCGYLHDLQKLLWRTTFTTTYLKTGCLAFLFPECNTITGALL